MKNYRIDYLKELPAVFKEEGLTVVGEFEEYVYGKLGCILDTEGRKMKL
ncbi:MAG: hypothetical protein WBG71_02675 [Leeuwenhoekiella sp.]